MSESLGEKFHYNSFGQFVVHREEVLNQFVQKSRMEKLLQACAGFVKQKFGSKEDIIDLKWLLIDERIELSILKIVYNGLNKENMPVHLQFVLKEPARVSRQNSTTIAAKKLTGQSVFIEEANEIFKNLPSNIRQEISTMTYYSFQNKLKTYMFDKSLAQILSSQTLQ